jgi:hypothetical protein
MCSRNQKVSKLSVYTGYLPQPKSYIRYNKQTNSLPNQLEDNSMTNINHLNKAGLLAHAQKLGLEVNSKMTKAALIELILDQEAIVEAFFQQENQQANQLANANEEVEAFFSI